MNYNDLYDEIINMINDEPIGFIDDLCFDVVNDYKYCDERIMKNKIYEKDETVSDTNTDISSDNDGPESSNMWETETEDDYDDE